MEIHFSLTLSLANIVQFGGLLTFDFSKEKNILDDACIRRKGTVSRAKMF